MFKNPSVISFIVLISSLCPHPTPPLPTPPVSLVCCMLSLPLPWEHMGWPRESLRTDAACPCPPAATSPSLPSTCLGHRPGGSARATPAAWPVLCYPQTKTKGYLGRPSACPRAGRVGGLGVTQCHEAGRPLEPGLSITCPLSVCERQGASVVCE